MVLIIEDSHADAGLVTAISTQWQYIFGTLLDYLEWLVEDTESWSSHYSLGKGLQDKLRFLKYGAEELHSLLALAETRELLSRLPLIRAKRIGWTEPDPVADQPGMHTCSLCDKPVSKTEYERLEDGRIRCPECKNTSVDTVAELKEIYALARAFVDQESRGQLTRDIDIEFATPQRIREVQRIPVGIDTGRAIGLAMQRNGMLAILIEKGPYHQVLDVTTHELTHFWQFTQIDYRRLRDEHDNLLNEGHAMWAGLTILQRHNVRPDYVERQAARTDVYGEGLHTISALVERDVNAANPFEWFSKHYPLTRMSTLTK